MAFSGGSGTSGDPYLISTITDLEDMDSPGYLAAHFKLTTNIDMSTTSYANGEWGGIGNVNAPFTGVFDGNNKILSNIKIKATNTSKRAGLFANTSGGEIKNLIITNGTNVSAVASAVGHMGFIAGTSVGTTITNCHATGAITDCYIEVGGIVGKTIGGTISYCSATLVVETNSYSVGGSFVGGIVGESTQNTVIYRCKTDVTIDGQQNLGGIAGYHDGGSIIECYSTGSIKCRGISAGGIVGLLAAAHSTAPAALIKDCYSWVSVEDTALDYRAYAGLIGYIQISAVSTVSIDVINCYSVGAVNPAVGTYYYGGLIGYKPATKTTITSSFYDQDTSGQSDTGKGEPHTTSWMKTQANFTNSGWDFDTVWTIANPGTDYPLLRWDVPAPDPDAFVEPVKEPKILIRWRNNGKSDWTNYREINLGDIGRTEIIKRIRGLGQYRTRQYEIVCTSGVPLTISGIEET